MFDGCRCQRRIADLEDAIVNFEWRIRIDKNRACTGVDRSTVHSPVGSNTQSLSARGYAPKYADIPVPRLSSQQLFAAALTDVEYTINYLRRITNGRTAGTGNLHRLHMTMVLSQYGQY